jgi:phosphate transport system permease protein
VAVPLALGAAIYTGYFLSRHQRNRIKPAIELLEAFPTVVLGFLAGLWLAPLLADYLLWVFLLPLVLVLLPLLLALLHLLLQRLSPMFAVRPPRAQILALAYLLVLPACWYLTPLLEQGLFAGSLSEWLLRSAGLRYEQRNALLVGLAMGLALLPTLFSIVEDAVFAVPRGLSDGSLALGATRWQSLSRVVLPAASPAILSALLIGFARGLGETMIVLLATGNTPVIEYSALLGLRSLSASLAVELPEAAVGSVQFRVLFLAALVLFALTFFLNTLAELFRQRLRYRYAGR